MKHIPKLKHREEYNLLVIRITKHGSLSSAKPCYHCIKQLINANNIKIKNVYYSDPPGIIQCISFNELAKSVINGTYDYISSGYRVRMHIEKKIKSTI